MITIINSKRKLRDFIVYDLEWVPGSLELRMVGVFDGQHYRSYGTIEAFLSNELTNKNRGKWFYAHAGGLADLQFIFEKFCISKKYKVTAKFSGSSAIIVNVVSGKNAWHFIDSYWLLRDKLKNIAKWIGMEKGGIEEKDDPDEAGISDNEFERRQLLKREWFKSVPLEILYTYNQNDCEILWKAIKSFHGAILDMGGQLQMTLASSAMHLFRRKYLSKNIETSENINEISRQSYFASRVEVFEKDIINAYYYDINSSFPYSMTSPCPGEFLGRISNRFPLGNKLYISDVEIEVPDAYFTSAPLRLNGRVFFPSGSWRAWLTNIDIELLQREGGRIQRVHESLVFEPFYDLANYAQDLYSKRKKSNDEFERTVYKLLLNSLYGKFAESCYKQQLIIDPDDTSNKTMLLPGVWIEEKKVDVPHVHVPISSHITALSRKVLFDYMSNCTYFHYCDTDGFSTTENLSTGKDLGKLKLEKRIQEGQFVMPKFYRIQGQAINKDDNWENINYIKAKGFSRMTTTRFLKLLEGESISYERMSRIKENIRCGNISPRENTILKQIRLKNMHTKDFNPRKHVLPKRFTYPDGHTRPWHISELRQILKKTK